MLRVRVTSPNFYRLEATGGAPKKKGAPLPRAPKRYAQGDIISVSEKFFELHRSSLQVLGVDRGKEEGRGKSADETLSALEALRAEARELGIEVDKRWRAGRLASEIEAALEKKRAADGSGDPGDEDSQDDDADDGD